MVTDSATHDDGSTTGAADKGADEAERGQLAALKAEREKRQGLEKRLADIEGAAAKAAEEAAKKRGEFEGLYAASKAELEAKATRLAELEAREATRLERVVARNAERTKALSEAHRALVPGLDPDAVADWLDRAEATLAPAQFAAGTRGKASGAAASPKYPAEAMTAARQYSRDQTEEGLKGWIERAWLPSAAGKAWQARQSGGGG